MYCNKIGETLISAYKANGNAATLKNFEELLKVHNLLILYCGDKFGQLCGFAVSGFIQSLTDVDETCFKLQVQYLLAILTEDQIVKAVFVIEQDEEKFWEDCGKVKEGQKYTRIPVIFRDKVFNMLVKYCHERPAMMYENQNLKNMATVMKKLVEFQIYDEMILDLLVHICYHHDQHFETHYEEDNLLRNTESSILPVTLAYHIQKQLAAFLQARDVEFKFKAVKLLIPILCRTSNQLSFKHIHKIILDQFLQCDEEKKYYIFEQLKKYAIENITTQISPYAPFIFYHTLLVMMK